MNERVGRIVGCVIVFIGCVEEWMFILWVEEGCYKKKRATTMQHGWIVGVRNKEYY